MGIAKYSKFHLYKNDIQSLETTTEEESLINERFLLDKDVKKQLEVYYAPFEHVNEDAKIVIVGITPGLHQMKKSYETVWNLQKEGLDEETILQSVKNNSSFQGPMRKNLVAMLDELELHTYLGVSSTQELFDEASDHVQTTSILPYPVFYKGSNYSGATPNLLRNEMLKKYATEFFPKEMEKLHHPLIIPLGVNVSKALRYLEAEGLLSEHSILEGFPHPSGGNGHRHRQFEEHKEQMRQTVKKYFGYESLPKEKSPIMNEVGAIFVPVRDIEKARDWYCDLLGMEADGEVLFGHLYMLPMEKSDVVLDSKIYEEGKTLQTPAFHFNTNDIHASYQFMKDKGVELVTDIQQDHFFNFKDPDGNLLMVCKC